MREPFGTPPPVILTEVPKAPASEPVPLLARDALKAFGSERNDSTSTPGGRRLTVIPPEVDNPFAQYGHEGIPRPLSRVPRLTPVSTLGILVCVLAVAVVVLLWRSLRATNPAPVAPTTGTATINSRPEGLAVVIDDTVRGKTPLDLTLPVGNHTLQIQAGAEARSMPLIIAAGTSVSQYIDLSGTSSPPSVGSLEVKSQPPGSSVRLDGTVVGITPLALHAVPVGDHVVVVGSGETGFKQTISVLAGTTASIVASSAPPTTTAGWVSFKVPFELDVLESGRLIGTTSVDRLMLPVGSHTFDLENAAVGFRTTVSVQVVAGRTTNTVVAVPNGSLSINATPWAEVEIDGASVGTTPLANIKLPIGTHVVVWKHPQYGERRRTVAVTPSALVRTAVDFASDDSTALSGPQPSSR